MRSVSTSRQNQHLLTFVLFFCTVCRFAHAQDDGMVSTDGGGQEILQSIFIPYLPNAPFSLTLTTEWARPLNAGGNFTVVNSRPIMRDSTGRIYMERWLLVPKGSGVKSQISHIQIADPIAHTLYQCNAPQHVCELLTLNDRVNAHYQPNLFKTESLPNGDGTRTHQDLGAQFFAGLPVHRYRDTTTLNPGVFGNDRPMSTVREFSFSPELGFNLSSVLDTPSLGRQTFTVTEINTNEPNARFFQPPEGYRIVDRRKASSPPAAPAN